MNTLVLPYLISISFFLTACSTAPVKETNKLTYIKDTTVYYLDSAAVVHFFEGHTQNHTTNKLYDFYKKRNYAFAWINANGINEYAGNFMNMLRQEQRKQSTDSQFYYVQMVDLFQNLTKEKDTVVINDSGARALELLLTINFFDYVKRNWGDVNDAALRKVGWYIDRHKINPAHYLDTVLDNNQATSITTEPTNRQYGLLKNYLIKYNDINKRGGLPDLSLKTIPKKGDTAQNIPAIKNELFVVGDLATNNATTVFDDALETAIKQFQNRYGLIEDGRLTEKTIQALRVPIDKRIEQILINMERSRWVPVSAKGDYLVVNIPEYKLHVYNSETLEWSCNVVVGNSKSIHNSVIFNDKMENVVFSPYWNVPKGILNKEVIPGIQRNSHYLANHNMEIVTFDGHPVKGNINWSNFQYLVREKPGIKNSLGLVKFLFPNSYDIYLHDSPEKSLFNESNRAFSHGCIRVQEAFKLAKYLLRNDPIYTDEKMTALMNGGKETFVPLKTKVPVFIVYFTAFVDRAGKLNFRNDIYGNDAKMKQILFTNK